MLKCILGECSRAARRLRSVCSVGRLHWLLLVCVTIPCADRYVVSTKGRHKDNLRISAYELWKTLHLQVLMTCLMFRVSGFLP